MKINVRYLIIPLLFVQFFPGRSLGQEKLSLTIEQSIETGLQNSKALHLSSMKVQAAESKSSEVNASRLPIVKASGTYNRLSDVPAFKAVIPQNAFGQNLPAQSISFPLSQTILDNYNLRLTVQQPLFTGFRLQNSANIADYTAQATEQDYNKDRSQLIYDIKNAYWSLYKAIEFKKVIDENIEQMKAHLKNIQNLYAQGIVTKNEVLKVEVQLSNTQLMQLDAQNNVRLAAIALNNVIGVPLMTEINPASAIEAKQPQAETVGNLVTRAIENRPEVKGMDFRVKANESAVTLARSGWYPQVYLIGNYYYSNPNQRIIPSVQQFKDSWDIGVAVSFDIWNWGTTIHQTNQAQAQLAEAQDALGQLKDAITLEVTQNYLNLVESGERIGVAEKAAQQAEENYRITNEKFKAGLALNSDLLDAEVALLQAKWNSIQAHVDHELVEAQLQKVIGNS